MEEACSSDHKPHQTSARHRGVASLTVEAYCLSACAGLKEHEKALAMFLFALTAPTMVVNAITMAAFRKHVLVSLIHTGRTRHATDNARAPLS